MTTERIADLLALLEDEPDDALLLVTLGKEYLDAGDAAAALPHLERAVTVDPRYTVAYRYLGTALEAAGRTADADVTWERGIAVAEETGDLQAGKEMRVFLERLRARGGQRRRPGSRPRGTSALSARRPHHDAPGTRARRPPGSAHPGRRRRSCGASSRRRWPRRGW